MSKYKDGGMNGGGNHANLPTEVKMMNYPDPYSDMTMDMQDDIQGIDGQIKADSPKGKSGYKPAKLN